MPVDYLQQFAADEVFYTSLSEQSFAYMSRDSIDVYEQPTLESAPLTVDKQKNQAANSDQA